MIKAKKKTNKHNEVIGVYEQNKTKEKNNVLKSKSNKTKKLAIKC